MTMRELALEGAERAAKAANVDGINVDKALIQWWERCVAVLEEWERQTTETVAEYQYCVFCDAEWEHPEERHHHAGCPFAVLYE